MSTLTPEMTVGEIAARQPASVAVFEQIGIDFCCGGKIGFEEACLERSLEPAAVMAVIEQRIKEATAEPPQRDWQAAPIPELVDHILATHHVYMKAQLPRLEAMLEKILAAHGERHGAVLYPVAKIYRAMKEELDGHLMKEEMVLFPLIRALDAGEAGGFHCGSVQNPIRVMLMEHDSAGEALEFLRTATNGYTAPEDACNTFRAFYYGLAEMEKDLHRHIHLENNILFPRAVELEAAG